LSRQKTGVVDPALELILLQQPGEDFARLQKDLLVAQAKNLKLA